MGRRFVALVTVAVITVVGWTPIATGAEGHLNVLSEPSPEVSSALVAVPIASAGSVGPQVAPATSRIAKAADVIEGLVSDTRSEVAHANQFAEFAATAATNGSVRLIVTLRMLWTPVPLRGARAQEAQVEAIATLQDSLLSYLVGTDHRVVQRYRFVPSIALELGEDGVWALEESGKVARLQQDVVYRVTLGDSVPLINGDDAWGTGFEGTDQVVAILDTGVEGAHPFLAGKVVEEACYSAGSNCPNGLTSQTGPGAGVNCTYTDTCGHGTHVAGIAAGLAPPGSSGVARDADIMAVQVFSRFDGATCSPSPSPCALSSTSDLLAGLEQVFALRTAHSFASVNMSLSGGRYFSACDTDPLKPAIDNLLAAGIPTVISSGNSGWENSVGAPGCISTAVTVASSTKTDGRSSFSNTAPFVDLIAPGSLISSSVPGGTFEAWSGTSMAAPHVAGAWAVVREAFPGASVAAVLQAFKDTGTAIQVRSSPQEFLPRIDVLATLGELADTAAPVWPGGSSVSASNVLEDSLALSWTAATDNVAVTAYRVFLDSVVVATTSELSYQVTGLDPATSYTFKVEAGDAADNWSTDGPQTTVTLPTEHGVGLVDPSRGLWYLRDPDGTVDSFFYGNPGDVPFMGDWDCDGDDTPGLFRASDAFAYLRNSNTQGNADIRFFFGNPSDIPLTGDFNGDGCDTLSLYRPSEQRFYIINRLGENGGGLGAADYSFLFGNAGDSPVVGDWDGDGIDEIGLHRESTGFFYWRHTLSTGIADGEFFFGNPADRFVAGDWGIVDERHTPAVFRPSDATFYFRHTLTQGNADSQFAFGESGWLPVAGQFSLGSKP